MNAIRLPVPVRSINSLCLTIPSWARARRSRPAPARLSGRHQRVPRAARVAPVAAFILMLAGCSAPFRAAAPPPQSPSSYLTGALEWLQSHEVRGTVNWVEIRRQMLSQAAHARTIADTYPALEAAIQRTGDRNAWLSRAQPTGTDSGYSALYPDGLVVQLEPGGAASRAGVRLGDRVVLVDGKPPMELAQTAWMEDGPGARQRLELHRAGSTIAVSFTGVANSTWVSAPLGRRIGTGTSALGYLDLVSNAGYQSYAMQAQQILRRIDQQAACGWIVDLRHTQAGDLWTYLAAVGPILGQGILGGFVYRDGKREPWAYSNGDVLWSGRTRYEGNLGGKPYALKRPLPPVALLVGPDTIAAGENVVVAFAGRAQTRTFGQPTFGVPVYQPWTSLSDGSSITASGAYSYDRTGRLYEGPIAPDTAVATDWSRFATDGDPAVRTAENWLHSQPACSR